MYKNKIINLFIFGCFPVRLFIAFLAYRVTKLNISLLPIMGIFGLIIGLGFFYNIINKRERGAFNQKVWWQNYRFIHSLLFLLFGVLALQKNENAYKLLFIDVILGLIFFTNKRLLN